MILTKDEGRIGVKAVRKRLSTPDDWKKLKNLIKYLKELFIEKIFYRCEIHLFVNDSQEDRLYVQKRLNQNV